MILKGNQRARGRDLALHLLNVDDNEHAVVHELRGFLASDLIGAFKEAEAISLGTKCQQYLFSLSLSPPSSANVPVSDFEAAIGQIERRLGLSGQPRAIVFHEKKGRRHAHCVWSRIDVGKMRAINLAHYKLRLTDIARELYREHCWEMPSGLIDREDRSQTVYTHAEAGQAKRASRDPAKLKAMFKACWSGSDSRAAFAAALREHGFCLARGDRRGFVAVDAEGEVYSLSRWSGVKAKELRARFGLSDDLPNVEQAQAALVDDQSQLGPHEAETAYCEKERDERLADLVQRQRAERQALAAQQEKRRISERQQRKDAVPKGLRAVWSRLSGGLDAISKRLEEDAARCAQRDRDEAQALIDRHLAERRALDCELTRPDIRQELERAFGQPRPSAGRRTYHPDPSQPLFLPPDDVPFTKAEIRARPDRVLDLLSDKQAEFTRTEIATQLAEFLDDPLTLRAAIDVALASDKLISAPDSEPETFTTKDYEAARANLAATASELAAAGGFSVGARHIEHALSEENARLKRHFGRELSAEQAAAIRHVLRPNQLSAIVGLAGAGKSTALAVARQAWEAQGYRVHGAALAGKAAAGLQSTSGIAARTLASLEASWKAGYEPMGHGDILVIDEAGMVGTRQMQRVAKALQERGCKLVLVGDPDQLQPIEAGTPFRDIVETSGAARLTEIRRQTTDWQRDASHALAAGETDKAMQAYADHGAVTEENDRDTAIAALIEDYLADRKANGETASRLALAHRRKDVYAINQAIKTGLREREGVKAETLFDTIHGPRAFAQGDRLLFTRNDAGLDVRNGMFGTVMKLNDDELTVRLDPESGSEGRTLSFFPSEFPFIDHGFAVTIHRSQGCTVERSFVLSSQTLDQNLTYVAMTRHKAEVTFYTSPEIKRPSVEEKPKRVRQATSTRTGPRF
ncbi:AAA family ATPase [Pararhizobium mangrovi]|uniref:Conjugal transfer protein TraA n=1 Tax=Pararhizobium mangrovi TaxID=2590452 RepID=A0A506U1V3_9HYPH|nr:AAA family ATPase [Pararhizobium mangrovi]TPW25837.1 conjugal transfer protein TraA [Pararhizobium mangrovi]